MLLTVLDSCSARAVSLAQRSSGRTTWILGDLDFPLDEVCRVGTPVLQKWDELLISVQRWARVVSKTMLMALIHPVPILASGPSRSDS